jgi:hypothetical protein
MAILPTVRAAAAHYGRTPRALRNWIRAGMPRRADGGFDTDAVDLWLRERRYLGASLRSMAVDQEVRTMFEMAVYHLRLGLQEFAGAYVSSRGRNRARLIDRMIREILQSTAHQASLLETQGEGGGDAPGEAR